MRLLLAPSLILLSVPKDLSLALFEWTGSTLMLSPQFIGSLLFYGLLITVWALSHNAARAAKGEPRDTGNVYNYGTTGGSVEA